jgi:hypothetical protein
MRLRALDITYLSRILICLSQEYIVDAVTQPKTMNEMIRTFDMSL